MRRLAAFSALFVVGALLMAGMRDPQPPKVRSTRLEVTAAGDSIRANQPFTVGQSPDSVRWIFQGRNIPIVSVTFRAPTNGAPLVAGPVFLVPNPVLQENDTVTVSACATAWKKGQAWPSLVCRTALFRRPLIPPVVNADTLQLSLSRDTVTWITPKAVALSWGQAIQFCTYSTVDGGATILPAAGQSPACGPTPASRLDPSKSFELRLMEIRVTLRPWFRDSVLDDPWEVYRAAQVG